MPRPLAAITAAILAALTLLAGTATSAAIAADISIPIDTQFTRADGIAAGQIVGLTSVPVADEFIGLDCTADVVTTNGPSTHPDSDILITSGGTTVVAPDVERSPGAVIPARGTLTLGSTVDVALRMGPDRRFSAGMTVTVDCEMPSPTTVPETTTSTTESTTTTVATTVPETTTPPDSTTTAPPSTAPPTTGEQTTTTVTDTSTTAPTTSEAPSTTAPPTTGADESPDELPRTGPATTGVLILVGLGLIGAGATLLVLVRRPAVAR